MDKIEIIEKELGHVIEIEEKTFVWKMPKVMPGDYAKLSTLVGDRYDHDDKMVVYARYVGFDWEQELSRNKITTFIYLLFKRWHFFTGIVTTVKIEGNDEIEARWLERRKYLKATHIGRYQDVSSTYQKLLDYSKEHDQRLENESIEFYLNDPKEVKEEELETVVLIPLRGS